MNPVWLALSCDNSVSKRFVLYGDIFVWNPLKVSYAKHCRYTKSISQSCFIISRLNRLSRQIRGFICHE